MLTKFLAALTAYWWLLAHILPLGASQARSANEPHIASFATRGARLALLGRPGHRLLPACDTYIHIVQAPPDPYYRDSATFVVQYGQNETAPGGGLCLAGSDPNPATFHFYVNGVDRTSAFSAGAGSAAGLVTALPSKATDTFLATITGRDATGASRTDSDQRSAYVDAAPAPLVDASPTDFANQHLEACAVNCFAVAYAQSTVPYISLGSPRSVTLVYHGDRAYPRPFLTVNVTPQAGADLPQKYSLVATVDGGAVTFVNGEQVLYFAGATGSRLLVGQFAGTALSTGMHAVTLSVTAYYANGQSAGASYSGRLAVVNEGSSPVARGWTIAGLLRAFVQTDNTVLVTGGSGSAVFYAGSCASTATSCTFTSPSGDFSRLTATGTGNSRVYVLSSPDSTKVTFNSAGQMTKVADRSGATTQFRYDGSGRLTQVTDPWRTWTSTSIVNGVPVSTVVPTYTVLNYGANGLSQIIEPGTNNSPGAGRTTGVTVNADRTLGAITDPGGGSTRFSYDAQQRLSSVMSRRGDTTTFTYNTLTWKIASTILPRVAVDDGSGGTTMTSPVITYSAPQAVGLPTGPTATTPATSVAAGEAEGSITDPGMHVSRMTLSPYGLPVRITDPLGNVTTISSTALLVTGVTYPTGVSDAFTYNGPFLVSRQLAGRAAENFRYGAFAQVDSTWGTGMPSTRRFIGVKGRMDSIMIAGDGAHKIKFLYDTLNRVLSSRDGLNHITFMHYDPVTGSRDSTLAPGNRVSVTRFDAYGRDSASRANGQPWRRVIYDQLNRPTQAYDGVNATPTLFGYDSLFQTRVTDAKGQVYGFAFDALGRLIQRTDPAGAADSTAYDADGLQRRSKNRRGQVVSYTYDALHRLLSKSFGGAVIASYGYSADGRISAGWNTVSRDSVFASTTGWTDSIVTRFPATGRRFQRFYRQNLTLGTLDSLDVSDSSGTVAFVPRRYVWNVTTGGLDSIRLGTSATALGYNGDQRPVSTTWPGGATRADSLTALHQVYEQRFTPMTTSGGGPGAAFWRGYAYDSLARMQTLVTRQLVSIGVFQYTYTDFGYDILGRISGTGQRQDRSYGPADTSGYRAATAPPVTFTYDAVGNRTDSSASYGAGNRIQQLGNITFGSDADGNVTSKLDASGNGPRYYWSAEGRLDSVVYGATSVQYEYNAFGQLVRRTDGGVVKSHFLWSGDQLLAELDATTSARIAEYAYYPGVDRPLAVITGATTPTATRYVAGDEVGNVIGLIDGTAVSEQYSYDIGGVPSGPLNSANRLRWKGLLWEDGAGLYYVRNRWYDPWTRRFMSEDPIGLAGGINPYVFANNDPIDGADPTGLDCEDGHVNDPNECIRQRDACRARQGWNWNTEYNTCLPNDIANLDPVKVKPMPFSLFPIDVYLPPMSSPSNDPTHWEPVYVTDRHGLVDPVGCGSQPQPGCHVDHYVDKLHPYEVPSSREFGRCLAKTTGLNLLFGTLGKAYSVATGGELAGMGATLSELAIPAFFTAGLYCDFSTNNP